tara:strand:- start:67 stop:249 length:183 start_codon:yes stop_codon:yes gene_type:complete
MNTETLQTTEDVLMAYSGLLEEGSFTEEQIEKMPIDELQFNFTKLILIPYAENKSKKLIK